MDGVEVTRNKLGAAADWLPRVISNMQRGDLEANLGLPNSVPLKDDIVEMTRIIKSRRELEISPDSLEKKVLLYSAELGNRVFTNKADSSALIAASLDANRGVTSDVLARIAYNEELAPFAQTLLCASSANESRRLGGYATSVEQKIDLRESYRELRYSISKAVRSLAESRYQIEGLRNESNERYLQRVDSRIDGTMIDLSELSNDIVVVLFDSEIFTRSTVELRLMVGDLRKKSEIMGQASLDLAV